MDEVGGELEALPCFCESFPENDMGGEGQLEGEEEGHSWRRAVLAQEMAPARV